MIAFTVIGIICVGSALGLVVVGLVEHVSTERKARQYARQWNGGTTEPPPYDVAPRYAAREAARDLSDESLAAWLGGAS